MANPDWKPNKLSKSEQKIKDNVKHTKSKPTLEDIKKAQKKK